MVVSSRSWGQPMLLDACCVAKSLVKIRSSGSMNSPQLREPQDERSDGTIYGDCPFALSLSKRDPFD